MPELELEATCGDRAFGCQCVGWPGHTGPHTCACGNKWDYYDDGDMAYFGPPRA